MPKNNSQRASILLASVTEELLGEGVQQFQDNSVRVENILLEMIRPDPIQPRRVLSGELHQAFHNNRLTPTQALRELVQIAQVAARQKGHPFTDVMDLLPKSEDKGEEEPAGLTPEEQLVRDLVNLAITIRDDGQVNPLTVVDMTQGVTRLYRIETGERRYWATWLLRDFIPNSGSDGTIPCIIIPPNRASVFRQAKENTARSGLTAIAMARQAALLLLAAHGYETPTSVVDNDFYRQAIDLDLRTKHEYTDAILSAMGGIGRMQFSHYKALLRLSDEAMELADRHNIDEKKLRYVVALPPQAHLEVLRQIVDLKLTSKQVQELCENSDTDEDADDPLDKLPAKAVKMARITQMVRDTRPQDFVRALLKQEGDVNLVRARIQSMLQLLDSAQKALDEERM